MQGHGLEDKAENPKNVLFADGPRSRAWLPVPFGIAAHHVAFLHTCILAGMTAAL